MSEKTLSTPYVSINNIVYAIVPNSLKFTEGFGEYNVRGSSVGGGQTETVFSENAENKMSKVSFDLYPTAKNIKSAREWKNLRNENLIELTDTNINRSVSNAALVNDYEVNIGAETTFTVEFVGDPAV